MELKVNWMKCEGDVWCPLGELNLEKVKATGVYIIWYDGKPGKAVRIGQ